MKTLQKFASVHASLHNRFNSERQLMGRQAYKARHSATIAEWKDLMASTNMWEGQVLPSGKQLALD